MCTAVVPVIPSSARFSAFRPNCRAFSGRACMYGSSTCTTSAPAAKRSRISPFDRHGVVERRGFLGRVVVVLRLLRHREGPGYGHLDRPIRVGAQKPHVLHLHRVLAAHWTDDARHGVGVAGAIERGAGIVDVHALERGGEAVGVALTADLAVGDDVEPGGFLGPDRQHGGIVLRARQPGLGHTPQLAGAHARREAPGQLLPGQSASPAADSCRRAWSERASR